MTTQYKTIRIDDGKPKTADASWLGLYKAGGVAGLMAGILLLLGVISLIGSVLYPGAINGWSLPFQNNWLMVIFKLHAGFSGVQIGLLHVMNYLDLAILAIVGTMHFGLYAALKKTSKVWSIIAAIQPFLGMALFIATKNAGRSGVMGATLIISFVMLRSTIFSKVTAYLGILASVLLLAGDFSAGVIHSIIITTLFGIGYVLLMIWMFLGARRLFHLGQY